MRMSVEIRELVIRASVTERATPNAKDPCDCDETDAAREQSDVVRAAVQEVLRILKASKER